MRSLIGIVVAIAIVLGIGWFVNSATGPKLPAVRSEAATIDKSEEMQNGRKALIEKLIASGIFQKVEVPGNLPRLWVRPAFYELDFDQKQDFVGVVYAFYFDGSASSDIVRLFDSRTGAQVGRQTLSGLELF